MEGDILYVTNACSITEVIYSDQPPEGAKELSAAVIFTNKKCLKIKLDPNVPMVNLLDNIIASTPLSQAFTVYRSKCDILITYASTNQSNSYLNIKKQLMQQGQYFSMVDVVEDILHNDPGNYEIYINHSNGNTMVTVTGYWSLVPKKLRKLIERLNPTIEGCGSDVRRTVPYQALRDLMYQEYYQ